MQLYYMAYIFMVQDRIFTWDGYCFVGCCHFLKFNNLRENISVRLTILHVFKNYIVFTSLESRDLGSIAKILPVLKFLINYVLFSCSSLYRTLNYISVRFIPHLKNILHNSCMKIDLNVAINFLKLNSALYNI